MGPQGAFVTGRLAALLPLFMIAAAVLGWFAPDFWLLQLRQRRQHAIRRALPDMLDMLTISVQAGLGFDMALSKLVRNTSGPLAEEFARMLNEVQSGISRRDGFRRLGERTDVSELNNFIMAMVQADVFGVSVSGILHAQVAGGAAVHAVLEVRQPDLVDGHGLLLVGLGGLQALGPRSPQPGEGPLESPVGAEGVLQRGDRQDRQEQDAGDGEDASQRHGNSVKRGGTCSRARPGTTRDHGRRCR